MQPLLWPIYMDPEVNLRSEVISKTGLWLSCFYCLMGKRGAFQALLFNVSSPPPFLFFNSPLIFCFKWIKFLNLLTKMWCTIKIWENKKLTNNGQTILIVQRNKFVVSNRTEGKRIDFKSLTIVLILDQSVHGLWTTND